MVGFSAVIFEVVVLKDDVVIDIGAETNVFPLGFNTCCECGTLDKNFIDCFCCEIVALEVGANDQDDVCLTTITPGRLICCCCIVTVFGPCDSELLIVAGITVTEEAGVEELVLNFRNGFISS